MSALPRLGLGLAGCLAVSLACAPAGFAQDCPNAQTQRDLDACAGHRFEQADADLNAAYRRVLGRLQHDAGVTKLLTGAQRAWLAFRDAECTFASVGEQGGTIYPVALAECRTELTRARTRRLDEYLACKDGDLNCPVPERP